MKVYNVLKKCSMIVICFLLQIRAVNAFMLPPVLPMSPSLDGTSDAAGAAQAAEKIVQKWPEDLRRKIADILNKINSLENAAKDKVDDVKGKVNDVKDKVNAAKDKVKDKAADKIAGIFGGNGDGAGTSKLHEKEEGEPTISTAREIVECKIADLDDLESILKAFDTLFGQYPKDILAKHPHDHTGVKKIYRNKATEFANDALVELYISARDLDERMSALQTDIEGLSEKYVMGETVEAEPETHGETGEANDSLGSWVNYYNVAAIYDSILRISEELAALDAQYEAAQALKGGIIPKEPEEPEEDKVSFNEYSASVDFAFAQKDPDNKQKYKYNVIESRVVAAKSPLQGTADQFNELSLLNNMSDLADEALEAHNMKRGIDSYKKLFVEYRRMKKIHEEVLKELKVSEECVLSHLGRYYENPVSIWLGEGCNYSSDNSIYCDKDIKVTKPALEALAKGDYLCREEKSHICNLFSINRYERRGGLSGWLLSAYKVAKADKTLEVVSEDFSAQTINEEETQKTSLATKEEMDRKSNTIVGLHQSGAADSGVVRPSDEVKMMQNDREREILSWQMGQIVAQNISEDMKGEENRLISGILAEKYPLWNDEKYFYKTYIKHKYNNMLVYIQNLDLRAASVKLAKKLNDLLYVNETEAEKSDPDYEGPKMRGVLFSKVLSYNNQHIKELDSQRGSYMVALDDAEKVQKEWDDKIKNLHEQYVVQKTQLEEKIKEIYAQQDQAGVEYNDAKIKYNELVREKQTLQSEAKADDVIIDVATSRSESIKEKSEKNKASIVEKIKPFDVQIAEAQVVIEEKAEILDDLKDELTKTKQELEKTTDNYINTLSTMEYNKEIKVTEALNSFAEQTAPSLLWLIKENATTRGIIFKDLINITDVAATIVRKNAINAVKEGRDKILQLNDDLYDADKYDKIMNIHEDMMVKIQNPKIEISALGFIKGYINVSLAEKAATKILVDALISNICEENKCMEADDKYYVGIKPGSKDFTAPKEMLATNTPPLREVVHFDNIDYENLPKSQEVYVAKESLLSLGYIPPIWKMLLYKGFESKDVPLIPYLEREKLPDIPILEVNFMHKQIDNLIRGGVYPCKVNNVTIDVSNGFFVMSEDINAPECRHIKSVDTKGINKSFTLKTGEKISLRGGYVGQDEISELSMLVYYDKNKGKLSIDPTVKKAMEYMSTAGDNYNKEQKYKSDNISLNRNQFGNFIDFVEHEMVYQKSLDQLDIEINNARKSILETVNLFEDFNLDILYTDPENINFDLSDEKTYTALMDELNKEKNERLKLINEQFKDIKGLNESLVSKANELKNAVALLETDKDELVNISRNMSLEELQERITQSQSDNSVQNEYEKEVDKSYQNKSLYSMLPYCAVY